MARPGYRLLLTCFAGLVLASGLRAHDLFTQYVHHRIQLTGKTDHLDLSFELTFFEESSEQERRRMDTDGDGRIERVELDSYVQRLSRRSGSIPRVFHGQRCLRLVPLYAPEVDLLGYDGVGRAHHRLVLHFFVPSPPALMAGDVIHLEDPFWPARPALVGLQGATSGAVDYQLRAQTLRNSLMGPVRKGEKRAFDILVEGRQQRSLADVRTAAKPEETDAE